MHLKLMPLVTGDVLLAVFLGAAAFSPFSLVVLRLYRDAIVDSGYQVGPEERQETSFTSVIPG